MNRKSFRVIISLIIGLILFYGFKLMPIHNYPTDADGDLIISEIKMRIIGNNEYKFTQAMANFYVNISSSSSFMLNTSNNKLFNNALYVNSTEIPYNIVDSTYKLALDTTLENKTNFTWHFLDLTDTNNVINFTTTKGLNRLDNFNLSIINSVSKSAGFTFSHPTITADSIIYVLGSDSLQSVKKKVIGQSSGVTFTSSELNNLANTSTGGFVILTFNIMPQTVNGKKYYFQNNSLATVMPLPITN